MLESVHRQIFQDAARVYARLTGRSVAIPKELPGPAADDYFDIAAPALRYEERGGLLEGVLAAFAGDRISLGRLLANLACPFHLEEWLYASGYHQDFDFQVECRRRDLPFKYDPEQMIGQVSRRGFTLWLERTMRAEIEEVFEAYEKGNGFPVLKASGFLERYYDRAANLVLAGWLAQDRATSASPSSGPPAP